MRQDHIIVFMLQVFSSSHFACNIVTHTFCRDLQGFVVAKNTKRGGKAQMITILHREGGFTETPKSDYVIYG